ncbi:Twin-arginine translocation pathway signal [Rubrobacter xylanophilus DSM 9941]|uniref:Twin-arginine translocation pathway signal n=1 Tax=Rubrobacter xylanophilus (strain DSM 9941 / JCM 11954 / NBRC 16129 / PRD-1) TaxID=266117 RepID=Q1AZG0_RUBXD|nr:tripartite tricarboxylate transporter substrate binding protein [Rubrobacter xylanophilus]ABG03218.1 Twin-arginine translocation pathway signal [Rubrobacter xylanophilus DSM 9941]
MGGGMTRREFLVAGGGALAGALVFGGCAGGGGSGGGGSGWEPSRNVVMIVPFEPGGGSDILGRAMAAGLEEVREEVNVSVENRAGGSGAVGYSYLLEQRGDPHFLLASETAGVALPITTETPFRWTDFTPVAQIAEDATLLIVRRGSDYRSLQDVVDAAREGRVTVGVAGATGLDTIVTSLVEEQTGVEFERVVFESGGEIVAALLGGDIDIASLNPSEVIGQLEAGKMRALAVFADERYERGMLAEIPTAREEGVDVSFTQYRGAFAAGGITPEQRQYWERAFVDWTKRQSYRKYIRDNYLISVVRTGEEFEGYLRDYEKTLEKVLGGQSR